MADHSGPSNVTSGNDPDIDMQGMLISKTVVTVSHIEGP